MTDSRWQAAAAAPAGIAALVGAASWITLHAPTPPSSDPTVTVSYDGDHDSVEHQLSQAIAQASHNSRVLGQRIDHARGVAASLEKETAGLAGSSTTYYAPAASTSSGWQAPSTSSVGSSPVVTAPAPTTHTTTGASAAPPP